MIKGLVGSIKRGISLGIILVVAGFLVRAITYTGLHTYAAYQTISKEKLDKYSKSMSPLLDAWGFRYCSSSQIKYKGKVFSVTNRHCCETPTFFSPQVNIGDQLETPLFISKEHDVCVLTATKVKKPLKLARRDVKMWDPILVMGYPRGFSLTPSAGVIILLNVEVNIDGYVQISHEAAIKILPGNSGSPVLNKYDNVVGLVYATYGGDMVRGILVPLVYVENALKEAYKLK